MEASLCKKERLARIPLPTPGQEVGRKALKSIRGQRGLSEKDAGSEMFYSAEANTGEFIARYERALRRLAEVSP